MSMRFPPPLRFSVPLVLFCIGAVFTVFSFLYESQLGNRALEQLIRRHVHFIGNQVSGLATYFISQGNFAGLQKHITQVGSDVALRTALVTDATGQILAATRFEYLHKHLTKTHLATIHQYAPEAAKAVTYIAPDGNTLFGLFPFLLPPEPGELVSSREGWLVLEYDLAHPKRQVFNAVVDRTIAVMVVLTLVSILFWLFCHYFLNKRMSRLLSVTKALASGNLQASANLKGSDEMAVLSRAFDEMAHKLERQHHDLRAAHDRQQRELEERRLVQSALENSEKRFRSIWENSQDAMRLVDSKGTILGVNPAFCKLVGMSAEELLQRPFWVATALENPPVALEQYQKQFLNRELPLREHRSITYPDGRLVHLDVSFTYIPLGGEHLVLLGIFRDVTERILAIKELQREKEFSESLIRTANVLVIGLDHSGKINLFNETAERVLGWRKEEVLGGDWYELFIPKTEQPALRSTLERIKTGSHETFENRVLSKSGRLRLISWKNNQLLDEGEVIGTLSFGIDVTEQREEEIEHRRLAQKLQEAQKLESLGVLAGGIAHDFNNLLTAILGNASLAAMQLAEDSPARPMLHNIERTSLRAADLCRQMLAYSGQGRFTIESINLNQLIKETTQLLQISISKKARLIFELGNKLPAIEGDPTQMRQVLMNLVINASEALAEKEGTIHIRSGELILEPDDFKDSYSAPDLPGGRYIYFEVQDTGCGMSPETQAKVFDPFFTTKFTGRGLGLAAVLGIVRSHKGALKLHSKVGAGSTFRVYLPVLGTAKTQTGDPIKVQPWYGKGTVLVVDDEREVRLVAVRFLQVFGFDSLQAADGAEAVELYQQNKDRIDLVLMDLTMPRLSGREAFAKIRAISPEVKVVLMSGYAEPDDHDFLNKEGWSGFLQKPFTPEEMSGTLQVVLGC